MKEKYCKECNKLLWVENKSGYCVKHLPRTGKDNSFYGKTHTKETLDKLSEKNRTIGKLLWDNPTYRNKVISAVVGTNRSEKFKQTQRDNAIAQMTNPKQREIRSKSMKRSWNEGRISPKGITYHTDRSKQEQTLYNKLKERLGNRVKCRKRISYVNEEGNTRWFLPDVLVDKNVVIEYFGDYWHAGPAMYKDEDVVHLHSGKFSAKEIRDRDRWRIDKLLSLGYRVFIVWEGSYKKMKDEVLNKLVLVMNDTSINYLAI